MAVSLAAFYLQIPVAHIEAGLRTYNVKSPFPEEINRQLTSRITDYHFAPTEQARENLLTEGVAEEQISVTGNTVIDALLSVLEKAQNVSFSDDLLKSLPFLAEVDLPRIVLVTGHRRKTSNGFEEICQTLYYLAMMH